MSNYQRSRYYSRAKVCQFCTDKNIKIDYKDVNLLERYIDGTGKIRPRRQTGTCAKHQRAIAKAIKNARHIALLPFSG
jgi:small subunit ribosomal protein S18